MYLAWYEKPVELWFLRSPSNSFYHREVFFFFCNNSVSFRDSWRFWFLRTSLLIWVTDTFWILRLLDNHFWRKINCKAFFFIERVVFDARNDGKLVQTCQSPVILPFRFIHSNREHLISFRVAYVNRTDRIRMFWTLLPKNRSQITRFFFFFCSRIINLSFNGLTYNTCEHFVHC